MDIKKLREKIDAIDKEILDLLKERFALLPEVAEYKKENDLPIKDDAREREVINRAVERGKTRGLSSEFVRTLFEEIIEESRSIQDSIK
jgi:chorismate mutase